MSTCKQCLFCLPHPAAGASDPVGMCHGSPPHVMLLPGAAGPASRIAKASGPPTMSMQLQSVRPSVMHDDPACNLFQAAMKC